MGMSIEEADALVEELVEFTGTQGGVGGLPRAPLPLRFGPATAQDIGQFTMLRQPEIRAALEALGDDLVKAGEPASTLHDLAGAAVPDEDTPAPPRLR